MNTKRILELLSLLADATVSVYGRTCEAAVYDLGAPGGGLVHAAGNVNGLGKGAPAPRQVLQALAEHGRDIPDRLAFAATLEDGRRISCTALLVRDNAGEVAACWCITRDMTAFLYARAALHEFSMGRGFQETRNETFALALDETVQSLVLSCAARRGKHPSALARDERLALTRELDERGVFGMRGSVKAVSACLGVTRYTIYNYLKIVRKQPRVQPGHKE
ncbi:helix-turn-helix transcriptional regulator [Desulfocurvus sp. DL9XJH121]